MRHQPLRPHLCSPNHLQLQLQWHNRRRRQLSLFQQLSSLNRDSPYLGNQDSPYPGNQVNHSNQVSQDSHCPGNHHYLGSNYPAKFRVNKCLANQWLQVSLKQVFRVLRARRVLPSLQRRACLRQAFRPGWPPVCHREVFLLPAGFLPPVCRRPTVFHPGWFHQEEFHLANQECYLDNLECRLVS